LLLRPYGLLHASTGTGKTLMICEAARRCARKTLIVCDSLSRMTQMIADIEKIL
jgi:superfamily II DNA or RNA helicase